MDNLVSKGERKVRSCLFSMGISFETEKEFDNLINPDTKANLRFDFYLPEYNAVIEYDGSHHHTSNSKYHKGCKKSFIKQKKKDYIKDKYCKDNKIYMLRLDGSHYNKIASIIKEFIDNVKTNN